jgi:hypothetical protein
MRSGLVGRRIRFPLVIDVRMIVECRISTCTWLIDTRWIPKRRQWLKVASNGCRLQRARKCSHSTFRGWRSARSVIGPSRQRFETPITWCPDHGGVSRPSSCTERATGRYMHCSRKRSWHGITPARRRCVHTLKWQDSSTGFKTNPAISIRRQGAAGAKDGCNAPGFPCLSASNISPPVHVARRSRSNSWPIGCACVARTDASTARPAPRVAHAHAGYTGHWRRRPPGTEVVPRHAGAPLWTLRVYTDARSAKCSELAAKPFGHRRARLTPAGLLEWLVP